MADSISKELTIVGMEFGAMVKLYWVDYRTQETGCTELTYDAYNRSIKPYEERVVKLDETEERNNNNQ